MRRLNVLTWHVHGAYLYYMAHAPHDFYVPVKDGRPEGYGGRRGTLPWPENLHEIPADAVRDMQLDCVIFQSRKNYLEDQYELLSEGQRCLPRIYLEHDPPLGHPTDTPHVVDDPDVLMIHVTHFNALMWDSNRTPTRVIEHGVTIPDGIRYSGELRRAVTVVNNISTRGRRLGADVFEHARRALPIDIAGMGSEAYGGAGDLQREALLEFEARRRLFFNPIRYTSLGLSVCEAMMLGMPIVGMATTEMATAVEHGWSGYIDTNPDRLCDYMRALLGDRGEAKRMGDAARRAALERFNIARFVDDWDRALREVTVTPARTPGATTASARKASIA